MAAPAKDEDPAQRAQATLQRVSKLPVEQRRLWLRLIEQRYGGRAAHAQARRCPTRAGPAGEGPSPKDRRLEGTVRLAAAIGSAREGGHRPPGAAIPRGRLRNIPQATARLGRSAGSLVSHLVAVGKGRQPARTARSADGLAGRRHQGIEQGLDRTVAGRSEVWRRCPARSRTTRQAVDATSGYKAARGYVGENPARRAAAAAHDFLPRPELQARSPLPLRVPDPRRAIGVAKQTAETRVPRVENSVCGLCSRGAAGHNAVSARLAAAAAGDPEELTSPPPPSHLAVEVAVKRQA